MLEAFKYAREELKRVEHLVYVSLKYTRTVDVLMNTLSRMVEFYEYAVQLLLRKLIDEGKLEEIPGTPLEQANIAIENFDDELIQDNLRLYLLLRKILREENPVKDQEYRRHVSATVIIDQQEVVINIDSVTAYYMMQTEFLEMLKSMLE